MLEKILLAFGASSFLSLWGPFALLVLCGLGLPIPEDIILAAAGFLGYEDANPILLTISIMYVGILLGDCMIFFVGHRYGRRVLTTRFGQVLMSPERFARVENLFAKYGTGVIIVARFLPGFRAPVFLTSGTLGFSFVRFVLLDGFAALVSAPLFVFLGALASEHFGEDLRRLKHTVGRTQFYLVAVILLVIMLFFWFRRMARSRNET